MLEDYEGTFFETEKGYTLNDILMELQEYYPHMSIEPQIEYAYLDCGADGIEEMALRIKGMGIYNLDDDSTIVCVIKEIEEKLECSYFYETWARSDTQLNYYGYVTSGGSNSASNHGWSESYIDKDGKWNFICYIEEEYDITAFSWNDKLSALSDVVADKQYDGTIVMTTIRFEEILDEEDYENVKRYYSYYVDSVEDDVYMDGIYSEIFEEAGVEIDQLEEIE